MKEQASHRFDSYTKRARRVLASAGKLAIVRGRDQIEADDIFNGICLEQNGIAFKALLSAGINLNPLVSSLQKQLPQQDVKGTATLSDEAYGICNHARATAERLGHNYIGTEHLLMGYFIHTVEQILKHPHYPAQNSD